MISLGKLKWGYAFSYLNDNEIDFNENQLLQLVGKNGHGKTSISLILEEVLFNKNSKGVKKADVLNRYSKEKSYWISLEFTKDEVNYFIYTKRGSTQSVKLSANGEDISAHTSTATYKLIEGILGLDHKTFTQIVIQSSAASLEFLTATDSNRKKFLIELLNLTSYTKAADTFKDVAKRLSTNSTSLSAKIDATQAWLTKNLSVDLNLKELVDVPLLDTSLYDQIASLKQQLLTIDKDNKLITQNNKYKELADDLKIEAPGIEPSGDIDVMKEAKTLNAKLVSEATSFIKRMNSLKNTCETCKQPIDISHIPGLIAENQLTKDSAEVKVKQLTLDINKLATLKSNWSISIENMSQYEFYHSLYNPSLSTTLTSKSVIDSKITVLEAKLKAQIDEAKIIQTNNNLASSHNAKVAVISEQSLEFKSQLLNLNEELAVVVSRLTNINILVKTFSTTGLVAYKIECLVKDLEELTNNYLVELSDGRFQLRFEVSTSDKLNVIITDNGRDIDILALSGGERARVNIATLLGIRKLLQALSNSRINLLFLDEVIDSLDDFGKEKLVEVLLEETSLNTVVVSHSFSHPLVEKLHVVKTNNISRIEGT